ncbi:hypothetical protein PtB15_12B363 [Puccinia triticina]|nr:hypothetical protein PtB15_12B363 [Puccinia triticina]
MSDLIKFELTAAVVAYVSRRIFVLNVNGSPAREQKYYPGFREDFLYSTLGPEVANQSSSSQSPIACDILALLSDHSKEIRIIHKRIHSLHCALMMRRFGIFRLVLSLCGIAVIPPLIKAAFRPIKSSRVRFLGVGSSGGGKNYYRPIPENEGRIWRAGSDPDFHLPSNFVSEPTAEGPSTRRNTRKVSVSCKGRQLEQAPATASKSRGRRRTQTRVEPKRARLDGARLDRAVDWESDPDSDSFIPNWQPDRALESFLRPALDQAAEGPYLDSDDHRSGDASGLPSRAPLDEPNRGPDGARESPAIPNWQPDRALQSFLQPVLNQAPEDYHSGTGTSGAGISGHGSVHLSSSIAEPDWEFVWAELSAAPATSQTGGADAPVQNPESRPEHPRSSQATRPAQEPQEGPMENDADVLLRSVRSTGLPSRLLGTTAPASSLPRGADAPVQKPESQPEHPGSSEPARPVPQEGPTEDEFDALLRRFRSTGLPLVGTTDPASSLPRGADAPIENPESRPEHPGSSQPTRPAHEVPQEGSVKDEFDAMLRRHRPKGLPSPLVGVMPPVIPLDAQIDHRKEPECARLAEVYAKKFQPALRRVDEYQFSEHFWMGQARIGVDFPEGGLIIGPVDPKESMALVVPLDSSGDLYDIEYFSLLFTELHKWIIYAHDLLWEIFESKAPSKPDLRNLEFWLLGEIFSPKQGLPVLGRVSLDKPLDRTFGPVQDWMAKYLHEQDTACNTALGILAIWLKNTCTKEWKLSFRSDDYFWARAASFIQGKNPMNLFQDENEVDKPNKIINKNYARTYMRFGNTDSSTSVNQDDPKLKLGNFELLDMTLGPPYRANQKGRKAMLSWMSGARVWQIPSELVGPGRAIIDRFAEVYAKAMVGTRTWYKTFEPENVVITRHNDGVLCVRHLSTDGNPNLLEPRWFKKRLDRLLIHIEAISAPILSNLSSLRPAPSAVPPAQAFFDWFSRRLFGGATERFFPLFGTIKKTIVDAASTPDFDHVQLFLLKVCYDESTFKYLEAALVLFGYWLKNENQDFWNEHIQSDQFYSKFIISALPQKFTNLCSVRSRRKRERNK